MKWFIAQGTLNFVNKKLSLRNTQFHKGLIRRKLANKL